MNPRGLISESRRAKLTRDVLHLGVNVCYVQEILFSTGDYEDILSSGFSFYSVCFDGRSRGVSCLESKSLNTPCALVFAVPTGRQALHPGYYYKG